MFSKPCTTGAKAEDSNGKEADALLSRDRAWFYESQGEEPFAVEITLDGEREFNLVTIKETIERGQKVEAFSLEAFGEGGWREIYRASTIGYQRICRFERIRAEKLRLNILKARGRVSLTEVGIYLDARETTLQMMMSE